MDFHSLTRRELQSLCKKNRIPANMTNVSMADALRALPSVEGIGEIQDPSDFLSPKKAEVSSSVAPRTTSRTSVLKKIEPDDASKEQTASPLPRARRVTARTSEIMRMVSQEEEKDVEEEKQRVYEIVPDPKPQATATRSTRRRATKKEEGAGENDNVVQVTNTPATRNGRRMTTRRGAATPIPVEEVEEDRSRNTRMTRQATKAIATAATTNVGTRSSKRGKGAALVRKMEPFDPQEEPRQEEMQQEKDERDQDIQDILGGSVKEYPDQGKALCSLNLQEKVAVCAKEDEVIQGMERVHQEQLSEIEEGSQGLVPNNQTGREESTESQVVEDVKEDEIEMQVTCQDEQASEAEEECRELVEKKQEDFALLDQEESPIKGLITEDKQKKQDESESLVLISNDNIPEASNEYSIRLSGNQPMTVETISIGPYSKSSLALGNDGNKTGVSTAFQAEACVQFNLEEFPVKDEIGRAYSAVDSISCSFQKVNCPVPSFEGPTESSDIILTAAGKETGDSAEMSAELSDKLANVIGGLENIKVSEVSSSPEVRKLTLDEEFTSEILEETLGSISDSQASFPVENKMSLVENDKLTVVESIDQQSSGFEIVPGNQANDKCNNCGALELLLDVEVVSGYQAAAGGNKSEEVKAASDTSKEALGYARNARKDCALNLESKTFGGMDASVVEQFETKPKGVKQDVSQLSLRKLRKIYKEISKANNVEGKRMPLSELNENLP